jgi:hypothetical protein
MLRLLNLQQFLSSLSSRLYYYYYPLPAAGQLSKWSFAQLFSSTIPSSISISKKKDESDKKAFDNMFVFDCHTSTISLLPSQENAGSSNS